MLQAALSTIPPQSHASYSYECLKTEILRGAIPGGMRIRQADIAQRLGISVTPVREAIRRLTQDGLLESAPHRGTRVVAMTAESLNEIYDMREVIEPLQMRRTAGKLTVEAAHEARVLCDEMKTLTEEHSAHFIELNARFHALAMVHDHSWMSRVVKMLQDAASPYVAMSIVQRPSQIIESNEDHYEMLDALLKGDIEKAVAVEIKHLESTRQLSLTFFESRSHEKVEADAD